MGEARAGGAETHAPRIRAPAAKARAETFIEPIQIVRMGGVCFRFWNPSRGKFHFLKFGIGPLVTLKRAKRGPKRVMPRKIAFEVDPEIDYRHV